MPFRYPSIMVALLALILGMNNLVNAVELRHGYADSSGVKIHFVEAGQGPLVILIHGFPDFWYTWRDQIPDLAEHFHVVAIDQRGYNKSDQPKGVEHYTADKLVGDVKAVIDHFKQPQATIVGHDWGGFVAWSFAMTHPKATARLIVLNLPHPRGLIRELANNPEQHKNSQYARNFQQPGAAARLTAEGLAGWVREPEARKKYVEAFQRSSFDGMLNYYKANYPRQPYQLTEAFKRPIKCPVLVLHGLQDRYLLSGALNDTWKWVEKEFTLVTIPEANHFVHRDVPKQVSQRMVQWLKRH
ncbi:MAG: alpha/beta hydrolase [Pirellulaceae bacterium]